MLSVAVRIQGLPNDVEALSWGKTRVDPTVDVECAEERRVSGGIRPALGYDIAMWGRFVNQREDLGIGLIMRETESYGLRATFFC